MKDLIDRLSELWANLKAQRARLETDAESITVSDKYRIESTLLYTEVNLTSTLIALRSGLNVSEDGIAEAIEAVAYEAGIRREKAPAAPGGSPGSPGADSAVPPV